MQPKFLCTQNDKEIYLIDKTPNDITIKCGSTTSTIELYGKFDGSSRYFDSWNIMEDIQVYDGKTDIFEVQNEDTGMKAKAYIMFPNVEEWLTNPSLIEQGMYYAGDVGQIQGDDFEEFLILVNKIQDDNHCNCCDIAYLFFEGCFFSGGFNAIFILDNNHINSDMFIGKYHPQDNSLKIQYADNTKQDDIYDSIEAILNNTALAIIGQSSCIITKNHIQVSPLFKNIHLTPVLPAEKENLQNKDIIAHIIENLYIDIYGFITD